METKFTKGEWMFYETPNYHKPECSRIEVSSVESSLWICKVQNSGYIAENEGLANAKLIASAPKLLGVAIKCLEWCNSVKSIEFVNDLRNEAEAAIKKATE
jgi:hypothetical protein